MIKKILNLILILIFMWIVINAQAFKKKPLPYNPTPVTATGYKVTPGNMQKFYQIIGAAIQKQHDKDYDSALALYQEALTYAEVQPEAAMVHHGLAEIYKNRGDYQNELASQKAIAKYTMNKDVRAACNARIEELLKLLNSGDT